MSFEWSAAEAASNAGQHGADFADAIAVLDDDWRSRGDQLSAHQQRWIKLGVDALGRLPVVIMRAIRLDNDVWCGSGNRLMHRGGSYQAKINEAISQVAPASREPLESTLRPVIREELKKTG